MFDFFSLPRASTLAANIDYLYDFIFYISLVSFIGIVAALIYFVWRYNRKRQHPDKTPYIEGHTPSELAVSAGLFVLVMAIFVWGWIDYVKILKAPADALEINIIGKQWMWETEYTNGRRMTNEIVVPKGKPVKLLMVSNDVLHSFFVPAFRLKQDLVPKAYTTLWFEPTQVGEFPAYCAEYCGTSHSGMIATVRVVEAEEYDRWQQIWELEQQLGPEHVTKKAEDPVERGRRLFSEKGCNACHSLTGKSIAGPELHGIFGKTIELADGKKVLVDENYLRESLMDPQAKVTKGFQPVMPTYKGQLTDTELNGLVALIKNLKN